MLFICWEVQYDKNGRSYGQLEIGNFITTMCSLMYHISCRDFWGDIKSPTWLSPPTAQIWHCSFWLFPKLKSSLKGKRFRPLVRFKEIWWAIWLWFQQKVLQGVLNSGRDSGRAVWDPKVPTLKGTDALLSYVQCFLYLLSFSVDVSIFHITWLDTFWMYIMVEWNPV